MSSEFLVNQVVVCISDGGGQSLTPAITPGGRPAEPQTRLPASGSQTRSPHTSGAAGHPGDPGGGGEI